jgi:hypothetical protein
LSLTYVSIAVVGDYKVDERNEEILHVFAVAVGEVRAEWVQDDEVLVWRVEEGLGQKTDHEAQQAHSVGVVFCFVVVGGFEHCDARLPDKVLIDGEVGGLVVTEGLDREARFE